MSFDLVVIGCGGGPSELNLSSYFFKARQLGWEQGILAVEAGSGLGALRDILASNPRVFDAAGGKGGFVGGQGSPSQRAASIYSLVRTFMISHAHFDHVAGLVIGAGATMSENARFVAGLPSVIKDIQTVFDGQKLWPRLVRQKNEPKLSFVYVYDPIAPSAAYRSVAPSLSAQLFPISHGSTTMGTYDSTAFFIRNDTTAREFLFLGDVEPDSVSSSPRNRIVWAAAAPKIITGKLGHVFLECSYRKGRKTEELFGHLSPEHVRDEMKTLAKEVVRIIRDIHTPTSNGRNGSSGNVNGGGVWSRTRRRRRSTVGSASANTLPPPLIIPDAELRGALDGVTLVVIHCKEPMPPDEPFDDIRGVIRDEIDDFLKPLDLGLNIIVARQGMCLSEWGFSLSDLPNSPTPSIPQPSKFTDILHDLWNIPFGYNALTPLGLAAYMSTTFTSPVSTNLPTVAICHILTFRIFHCTVALEMRLEFCFGFWGDAVCPGELRFLASVASEMKLFSLRSS